MRRFQKLTVVILFLGCAACSRSHPQAPLPEAQPVELQLQVSTPFHFVIYGDSRFHDPKDTEAASPPVRQALVQAIAQASPAFISFGGDIVYNGYDVDDWKVWDSETTVWRASKIPVYPALGNHDLHGDEEVALANYFQRFPDLKNSRYYSVRVANALMLVLEALSTKSPARKGNGLPTNWTIFLSTWTRFSRFSPSALYEFVGCQDVWRRTFGALPGARTGQNAGDAAAEPARPECRILRTCLQLRT